MSRSFTSHYIIKTNTVIPIKNDNNYQVLVFAEVQIFAEFCLSHIRNVTKLFDLLKDSIPPPSRVFMVSYCN